MTHVRKTTLELIAEEEKKVEQVKSRMAELKARSGRGPQEGHSPQDRRRSHAHGSRQNRSAFRKMVQDVFNKAVTNPKHRAAILDLIDEQAFQEAMRAAARKADAEARRCRKSVWGRRNSPPRPRGRNSKRRARGAMRRYRAAISEIRKHTRVCKCASQEANPEKGVLYGACPQDHPGADRRRGKKERAGEGQDRRTQGPGREPTNASETVTARSSSAPP